MDSSTLFIENEQVPNRWNMPRVVRRDYTNSVRFVQDSSRDSHSPANVAGRIPSVMDRKRTHRPMNALQRLIAQYLADNPGETYSSIARRAGMSRSTVHSAATVQKRTQTPTPATIKGLARGMGMSEERVRAASGDAAGYKVDVPAELDSEEGRLIVAAFADLDDERKRELARRARFLLQEMREASGDHGEHDA
jgi:transcriptional regulator with XRE-family HTH domain